MFVLMVSACGDLGEPGRADTEPSAEVPATSVNSRPDSVNKPGVYEVGVDLVPGVYTTQDLGCAGFTASKAEPDIENMDMDTWLAGSMRVRDVDRIVLHNGEFFTSMECGTWQREADGEPKSADPTTLAGTCEILVGTDDLAQQALTFPRKPESAANKGLRDEIQTRLSTVVFSSYAAGRSTNRKKLYNSTGELVDFLDDPSQFVEAGKIDARFTGALARIRKVCGSS